MTPAQLRTFDDLLCIGLPRPRCRAELTADLTKFLEDGLRPSMERWTERSLWFGKSQLMAALRCPGLPVAEASVSEGGVRPLHPATAVGIVTHRAVQLAHTHPDQPLAWYVEQAVLSARAETAFAAFWDSAAVGLQSDVVMQSVSRAAAFLDSWPALDPAWSWRFEESMQAKVAGVTLSARVDLVLGRPKPGHVQSMLLCDLKTGGLYEHHDLEAAFYALVAALRYGVPPFRSTVYSLSSGTWTEPDVTETTLFEVASKVVEAVAVTVDSMTEAGERPLSAGPHCRFCPAAATCPSADPTASHTIGLSRPMPKPALVAVPSPAEVPAVSGVVDHGPFSLD